MLVVLEAGLRLYSDIRLLRVSNFIREHVDVLAAQPYVAYDAELGWVVKPDTHASHFNTGAYGIRLADRVDRPIPQGAILAVGDSFTFGDEVDDDESWPAYLEAMTGTPVVNAASGAWGTDQIVLRTEQMIDVAHPKTVIIGFFSDDMRRSEFRILFGGQKPFFTISDGELALHNVPVPYSKTATHGIGWLRSVLGYSYAAVWTAERLGLEQWLYQGFVANEPATAPGTGKQISCLLLKRVQQRSDTAGMRLVLVMQYMYVQLAEPAPPSDAAAVVGCAADLGIGVVDTWAPLAALAVKDPEGLRALYRFHQEAAGHMSPTGNRLVAGLIAQYLDSRN